MDYCVPVLTYDRIQAPVSCPQHGRSYSFISVQLLFDMPTVDYFRWNITLVPVCERVLLIPGQLSKDRVDLIKLGLPTTLSVAEVRLRLIYSCLCGTVYKGLALHHHPDSDYVSVDAGWHANWPSAHDFFPICHVSRRLQPPSPP